MTHPWGGSLRRSLTGEETEDLKVIATSSTRDYFLSFKSNIDKVTFPTSPVTEIKSAKSRILEHSIRETLWYYHIIFIYRKLRLIHSERAPEKRYLVYFVINLVTLWWLKLDFYHRTEHIERHMSYCEPSVLFIAARPIEFALCICSTWHRVCSFTD